MADIIDINQQVASPEEIKGLVDSFKEILGEETVENDIVKQFLVLLSLDEKNFELLSPGILENFKQNLNRPNEKLLLVQSLNASGNTAEDVLEIFNPLVSEIDEMVGISNRKKDFFKELIATIVNSILDTEGIAKKYVQIPIELCHPDAKIPEYAHLSDSGLDVYALDDYTIVPGETKLIPTGFKIALPPGYEMQVRPKSGRALKTKLRVANTPGTIDAGYRDEVGIIIENIDPPIRAIHPRTDIFGTDEQGNQVGKQLPITEGDIEFGQSYTIGKGEKFAQLVLSEVPKASFFQVNSINEIGEDRGGGFGSTSIYNKDDDRYGTDIH